VTVVKKGKRSPMFVGSLIHYEESVLAEQELRNLQGMVYWSAYVQEQEHEPGTEDILQRHS
jgi:acyl dehydratase